MVGKGYKISGGSRLALEFAACIAIGIICTVSVAWIAVGHSDLWRESTSHTDLPATWPSEPPPDWPPSDDLAVRSRGLGWQLDQFGFHHTEPTGWRTRRWYVGRAGWPFLALKWEVRSDVEGRRGQTSLVAHQVEHSSIWRRGLVYSKFSPDDNPQSQYGWKRLPILPVWSGFAANTFGYALLMWAAYSALRGFVRLRRRSCVGCTSCGYELRGLPSGVRCPECGHKESASSVRRT